MSATVTWTPGTAPDTASYALQSAPDDGGSPGTFSDLVTIAHDLDGPNYDSNWGLFFYVDSAGTATTWYRVRRISEYSAAFQEPVTPPTPIFPATTRLNENFGGANALRYEDEGSVPIDDAQIRVYKKIDYDLQRYDLAIGVTTTTNTGGWSDPIYVEPGFTYVIQFYKPGAFGPDTREIVVP